MFKPEKRIESHIKLTVQHNLEIMLASNKTSNYYIKNYRVFAGLILSIITIAAAGCIYADAPPIIVKISDDSGRLVELNDASTYSEKVDFNLQSENITVYVEKITGEPLEGAEIELFWNFEKYSADNAGGLYLQDKKVTDTHGMAVFNKTDAAGNVPFENSSTGISSIFLNVLYKENKYSISIGEQEITDSKTGQLSAQNPDRESSTQMNQLVAFLKADTTDNMQYYDDPHRGVDYYVCVGFTRALAENATRSGIPMGGISLRDTIQVGAATSYYHTMNYCIVDEQFIIIEPQTDRIFTLEDLRNDDEYQVYKYITIFPDTNVMTNFGRHKETIDIYVYSGYNETEIVRKFPPKSNTI